MPGKEQSNAFDRTLEDRKLVPKGQFGVLIARRGEPKVTPEKGHLPDTTVRVLLSQVDFPPSLWPTDENNEKVTKEDCCCCQHMYPNCGAKS